ASAQGDFARDRATSPQTANTGAAEILDRRFTHDKKKGAPCAEPLGAGLSESKKPGQVGHNGPPPEYEIDDGQRPYYERYYISSIGASEFGLSMSALATLGTLCLFANGTYKIKELSDGTKLAPGQTIVGSKAVALRTGCDDKTVFAAYAELEARELMGRKSR